MAALLVLAGAIIHDKVKEKKEMKRRRVLDDERRLRQLQAETNRKEKRAGVELSIGVWDLSLNPGGCRLLRRVPTLLRRS
jgi:hypothetical protein